VFDDFSCLLDNPHIRQLWPLWRACLALPETALAGRPLASLSFALNRALTGSSLWGYHAANIALHAFNSGMVWALLRRAWRSPRLAADGAAGADSRRADRLALGVALVWAAHPLLTDAVTYVVQRTELLMAAALLTTLYAVARAATADEAPGPRRSIRWSVVAVAACAAGMLCKEVMVVAPLLAWGLDATLWSSSWRQAWRRRRGLYLGLFATWAILAALQALGARQTTAGFGAGLGPWPYLLTQAGAVAHYARLSLWPHPLAADYADWPLARAVVDVWPHALLVAAALAATAVGLRRRHPLALLGAWWFLILAPSSSLLPIATELVAERRAYLPSVAVVLGGALALRALAARAAPSAAARGALLAGLTAALALGGMSLTRARNAEFATEERLLRATLAARPRNHRARYNLAVVATEQGRADEAIQLLQEAVRLRPDYAPAHNNLGVLHGQAGRWPEAEAASRRAIALDPSRAEPHNNLGHALAQQGRLADAIAEFRQALARDPQYEQAAKNLRLAAELAGGPR
jgi:tetratricopeptide (TPR) repeat protein